MQIFKALFLEICQSNLIACLQLIDGFCFLFLFLFLFFFLAFNVMFSLCAVRFSFEHVEFAFTLFSFLLLLNVWGVFYRSLDVSNTPSISLFILYCSINVCYCHSYNEDIVHYMSLILNRLHSFWNLFKIIPLIF